MFVVEELLITAVVAGFSYLIKTYCACYKEAKEKYGVDSPGGDLSESAESTSSLEDYREVTVKPNGDVIFGEVTVRRDSNASQSEDFASDTVTVSEQYSGKSIFWEAFKETGVAIKNDVGSFLSSVFSPITNLFNRNKDQVNKGESDDLLLNAEGTNREDDMELVGEGMVQTCDAAEAA